ncbi:transmembrane protein, putative (macronuclear) [Tetrahymena thermophila SB210]|uniref:Transmembrane protein, putative n=1 Tax=Tetrahymena thermophila (strain SB210) TaxID=312017 RepID=Q22NN6_TETTS|nr:transmembrane protein, putative [Tetrahymena thermophila SB210]EAR86749.2 transmembrane protein, putative [Tetrahymena thermophila SB210]|eukprot:XP_001006994.2 transmembrane protein, putative [Tetrahymena thermophila SB210]
MKELEILLLFCSFFGLLTCLCNHKTQCFDQILQKCLEIDGQQNIGKYKKENLCIKNSEIVGFGEVEFCSNKFNSICLTKEKNKCVKISDSDNYVAIIKSTNQCVSLNENISNSSNLQEISFIKKGYCQSLNATIIKGNPGEQFKNHYLCLDQHKDVVEKQLNQDYCLERSTLQTQVLQMASGRTIDGICVKENEYYKQKVICNIQFCQHQNQDEQFTCIAYDSHLVIEIQKNGDCVQNKEGLRSLQTAAQCTQPNLCFDSQVIRCINLGSSQSSLAKLSNLTCAGLNVGSSIACYSSYPACLSDQGICQVVSSSNSQFVGLRQGGQCAQLNSVYQDLSSCSSSVCLTQYGNYPNQFCATFYGSSQSMMFDCNDVSQKSTYCKDPAGSICFDQSSQQCYQTLSFGGQGAGCQYQGTCQILSNFQFIGRAQPNNQCLQNYQQPNQTLETCFDDPQNICKFISTAAATTTTTFCVIYPQSSDYLGFVSENKGCAILNQVTHQIGYVADVINLRKNYCQDSRGYILKLDYSDNIGVDSYRYSCLKLNEKAKDTVIECQKGFCANQDRCQKYDSIMIGKNQNQVCLQERQPTSIECNIDDDDVCFDTIALACNHLSDTLPNSQGKVINGQCAQGGQYYSKIKKCSFNFCIQKQSSDPNSQECCFAFDLSQNRVGVDANGYCVQLDQQNAVRCMKGQYCLDNHDGFTCTKLILSKTLNKYSRQKNTMFCLPYLDPQIQGDQIETCVLGTCLYRDNISNRDYCVIEGTIAKGNFIVGIDVYQFCISKDQITINQIISCVGQNYCILQVGPGQQKCEELQNFDPNFPNLIYRAKNLDNSCQDLNMPNSIGCLDGLYCINTQNNNQCQEINDPTQLDQIGRDLTTQKCLPQRQLLASKCQTDYCINQGMCIPLSDKYPGKESKTHYCLQQSDHGQYGVSNCYKNGYCIEINQDGFSVCNKLDFSNPNRIGVQKDTQVCLKQNQAIAVMCDIQKFCINPTTQACQIIDITQNMCVDASGVCVQNGSCQTCNIDQCKSPYLQNLCINLIQPQATYCIDQFGICAPLNSYRCVFCPDGYCDIYKQGICVNGANLLNLISGNFCYTQLKNQNNKCVQQKVDTISSDGNFQCLNSSGMCQEISKNNNSCLLCPQYYVNPGNDKCLSLDEKAALLNTQQLYFSMQLIYLKQDCYDNQFCQNDNTKKCPKGCFSCTSQQFCTQCIQGYFLYQISPNQQNCIKCYLGVNYYTQVQSFYQNTPTYSCLDCSAEYGLWNSTQSIYKTCQNYRVQYDQDIQILANLLPASNFQVQQISGEYQLVLYQPSLCPNECFSCIQSSPSSVICTQCNIGYVLSNGICQKCPNNCQNCQYATFISGFAQLITEVSFDQNKYSYYNFILICLQCEQNYLVYYDLQSCQKCGNSCLSCQYENEESALNLKKSTLRIISLNEFILKKYIQKCTQCFDGYFLSYDGSSCLQNIQNCEYSSQIVTYGSQTYDLTEQLWTYTMIPILNQVNSICKQCSQNYIISADQTSCIIGCASYTSQTKCALCTTDSANKALCQFCKNGYALDNSSIPHSCQETKCQDNIYRCNECYSYLDLQSNNLIYQCTQCKDQYSIPSINGCLRCPDGCSECYEGTRHFNYTSIIVYKRPFLNLQERLNYNSSSTNYQLICTKCLQGYEFNQQLKQCVKLNCGQYCQQCTLINGQPQCIQCNYNLLASLIQNQQYFIGTLYYQNAQDFNIKNMVSLNKAGNDCQICPLMCDTCISNKDISINPLYLYDAQCYSCKKSLPSSKISQSTSITYDKQRRKCYLCLTNDQGCFYKKKQTIYIQCLDTNSRKGDGSLQNPINYNRLNEIQIDKFILNEIDYDQALIFYNELQVKYLEVQLIFLGDFCFDQRPQTFATNLKDSIRSIEKAVLNIDCQTTVAGQQMRFQQNSIFKIEGFNQIQINNIQFEQQLSNSQFGLVLNYSDLNLFQMFNCKFYQLLPLQNSFSNKQFLNLELSTLQKADIFFQQVEFQNIFIQNKQYLINNVCNNNQDSSLNVTLSSVIFTNVTLDQSSILQLKAINIKLNISNLTFIQSKFENKAIVFDVQPNYISSQQIDILVNNMTIQQTQILLGSQIINSNALNSMDINNITFIQNAFSQPKNQVIPLFISNTYKLNGLNVIQNSIINYSLFQQQDSLSISLNFIQYSVFQGVVFIDNQFNSNEYLFFYFKSLKNSNTQINGIKFLRNKFQNDQTAMSVQLENINTVQIFDVFMQDNSSFLFLQVKSAVNVLITKVVQTQTQNELMSPQICSMTQILNYVNIDNIQQQNINIAKNIIQIETSQVCLNSNQFYNNNQYPQGIFISNIVSNQVQLFYSQNTQNTSPFSIFSKQEINIQISNLNFSDYRAIIQTNQNSLGQISSGFYFKAPTVRAIFKKSYFTNLDYSNNPFNWIQGQVKQIEFNDCQFYNQIGLSSQNYSSIKSQKNGGFITINSELLTLKNSYFSNGFAFNGGALYWIPLNIGRLYIQNTTFSNNIAYSSDDLEAQGGALFINGLQSFGFSVFIYQSIFKYNFASFKGGAIQIRPAILPRSIIVIQEVQFNNNYSLQGSNLNLESSVIVKTAIILKKIIAFNQIQVMAQQFQNLYQIFSNLNSGQLKSFHSSLFVVQNSYEFQIENSTFQIIHQNIATINQNIVNDFIFQKMIFVLNTYQYSEYNNTYSQSVFLNNLVNITQATILSLSNNTIIDNININNDMRYQLQNNIQNLFFYSSQTCSLTYLNVSNNICNSCSQGIIYIFSQGLVVQNSKFENNLAQLGAGLYFEQNKNSQQVQKVITLVQNCIFKNNKAMISGGSIYIKNSPFLINQSLFQNNNALQLGGAIFIQNDNIMINQLQIQDNYFIENQSQFGGAIASSTGQSVNQYSNNTFILNKAQQYGQNIQTSPTKLNVYINNTLNSDNQNSLRQITLQNHYGGYIKENIAFKFYSQYFEELNILPEDVTLDIKILSGQGFINTNKLYQQNGVFNLTKQLQVYGIMGQELFLQITSDQIQIPNYNSLGLIVNYYRNYSLILNIKFAKICPVGQVIKQIYDKFNYCIECIDSYSFTNSDTCQVCPNKDIKCQGNKIFLTYQYWRVNQQSSVIYNCKNCIGDYNLNENQNQIIKKKIIVNDLNYYCQIGYIGALCEDCDITGQNWGNSYYMSLYSVQKNKCLIFYILFVLLQYLCQLFTLQLIAITYKSRKACFQKYSQFYLKNKFLSRIKALLVLLNC